jgi:hypothetical protein
MEFVSANPVTGSHQSHRDSILHCYLTPLENRPLNGQTNGHPCVHCYVWLVSPLADARTIDKKQIRLPALMDALCFGASISTRQQAGAVSGAERFDSAELHRKVRFAAGSEPGQVVADIALLLQRDMTAIFIAMPPLSFTDMRPGSHFHCIASIARREHAGQGLTQPDE